MTRTLALVRGWLGRSPSTDWQEQAACAERWEPFDRVVDQDPPRADVIAEAVAICSACPVVEPCAALVQTLPASWQRGVWGGRLHGWPKQKPAAAAAADAGPDVAEAESEPIEAVVAQDVHRAYSDSLREFLADPLAVGALDRLTEAHAARAALLQAAQVGSGSSSGGEGLSGTPRAS